MFRFLSYLYFLLACKARNDMWQCCDDILNKGKAFHAGALVLALAKIQDSRIGLFLAMESGGDVKFYSLGAPV